MPIHTSVSKLEHRIPPPVVVVLLGAAMWLTARYTTHVVVPGTLMAAGAIFALGVLTGGSGFRALRCARTTIDPVNLQAASVLVTSGIFRFSRNPMYVGFTALLAAWALFLSAPWAFVGIVAFVRFTQRFQIRPEERVMKAKFGTDYEDYCRRVRQWL